MMSPSPEHDRLTTAESIILSVSLGTVLLTILFAVL